MWKWPVSKPNFSMEEVKIATMKDMQEAIRWAHYEPSDEKDPGFTRGILAAVGVIENEIKKLEVDDGNGCEGDQE